MHIRFLSHPNPFFLSFSPLLQSALPSPLPPSPSPPPFFSPPLPDPSWVFSLTSAPADGTAPGRATVSNLRYEDPSEGAASTCSPCPSGTYSSSPTSRCLPCPAGTTSSPQGGGGTSCVPCERDAFAPVAGSPQASRPLGNGADIGLPINDPFVY